MTTLREAAQQALEALEWMGDCYVGDDDDAGECASCHERSYEPHAPDCKKNNAITALRAALAQQDEPVAYTTGHCENHKQKGGCQLHNLQCGWPDCDRKPTTASSQQAEPVEPVAWMFTDREGTEFFEQREDWDGLWTPLYTAPPQRKPLPKHDQHCVDVPGYGLMAVRLVRAVERAHGIKEN